MINSNPNPNPNDFVYQTNSYPTGRSPNAGPNTTPNRIRTTNASTANLPNNEIT